MPEDEAPGTPDLVPTEPFEAAGYRALEAEWDNRPVRSTRFPFPWPHRDHPRVQEFRERYDFLESMERGNSEMERLVLLRDWVHRQIPSGQPVIQTSDAFEILDTAARGGTFYCSHYAITMKACAVACGWVSRHLGIDSDHTAEEHSTHHGVVDVFVNELGKWVAMDAHHQVHYEKDGVPLSPWEITQEYIANNGQDVDICFGLDRKKVEHSSKVCLPGRHESCCYFWCMHRWHCDPFTRFGPDLPRLNLVMVGDAHTGKTWYQGRPPDTYPHICYSNGSFQFTRREADVYPDIGTCRMELSQGTQPNTAHVFVNTFTPGYESLLLQIDGGDFRPVGLQFEWYMHEGENRLAVRTRNQFGLMGRPSSVRAVLQKK